MLSLLTQFTLRTSAAYHNGSDCNSFLILIITNALVIQVSRRFKRFSTIAFANCLSSLITTCKHQIKSDLLVTMIARKDDAPASVQAAMANVAGLNLSLAAGGLIQTTTS